MLDTLVAAVQRNEKRFTVYSHDTDTDVEEQFRAHAVEVVERTLPPDGPAPFVVVEEAGEFVGAIPLDELKWLLTPPVVRPSEPDEVSPGYRVLFDVLDETVFTAMDRRQLLAVSREIEDRAGRIGDGELRVGFQTFAAFEPQVERYRRLATTQLDIHIYGEADWDPPEIAGITYHRLDDGSATRFWVLTFDGGPDYRQACGLLGRESGDAFEGFWTDDPDLVDRITSELVAEVVET